MPALELSRILETLSRHQVDFIVVGAVSAVMHGAPVTTFDLDIVHSRAEDNLSRLLAALEEMDAHFREKAVKKIAPEESHIAGPGHQLLHTRYGPLDVLGSIEEGHDYDSLLPSTSLKTLQEGSEIRVLDLEMLISLKEKGRRPKDIASLPVLKQTLEERNLR